MAVGIAIVAALLIGVALWVLGREASERESAAAPATMTTPLDEALGAPAAPAPTLDVPSPLIDPDAAVVASKATSRPAPLPGAVVAGQDDVEVDVKVVDPLGRPVPDARIDVFADTPVENDLAAQLPSLEATFLRRFDSGGAIGVGEIRFRQLCETDRTWNQPVSTFTTSSTGACRVVLKKRKLSLAASKPGVGTSGAFEADFGGHDDMTALAGSEPEATPLVRLELRPTARLTGQVIARDGRPVAGATVHCVPLTMARGDVVIRPRRPIPLTTDTRGAFEVDLDAPLFVTIFATADGEWAQPETIMVEPGSEQTLTLRFAGAFVVRGSVRGPEGAAAGARIDGYGEADAFPESGTVAEADGSFTLELAEPGKWTLLASADGMVPARPVSVALSEDQPSGAAALELMPSSSIEGRVVWESGGPAADISISASAIPRGETDGVAWPSRIEFPLRAAREAGEASPGAFRIDGLHPTRQYRFSAHQNFDDVDIVSPESVRGDAGGVELVVKLAGGIESGSIVGVVRDAENGSPVTDFEVSADWWIPFGVSGADGPPKRFQSATGSFRLDDLPPHAHGLRVSADGYPPMTVGPITPTAEGASVEVLLGRPGALTVHVATAEGAPAAGASVRLWCERFNAETVSVPAGPDGIATFVELASGRYALEASLDGGLAPASYVSVGAGRTESVNLELEEGPTLGSIVAVVRSAAGVPLAGRSIRIIRKSTRDSAGQHEVPMPPWTSTTDGEGRAILQAARPGPYSVWLLQGANSPVHATVTVEAGSTATAELTATL